MKTKLIREIFIANLILGGLIYPDYASAEVVVENSTIPESVPAVHFFLENLNSEGWIWFFRCVVIVSVLIVLISYIYFLNNKKKQEKSELLNTFEIDFQCRMKGEKNNDLCK